MLEETRLLFAQRLRPDDFVFGGTRRFPMAELTGLIDDVQKNKPLDSVTLPGRWNFKNEGRFGYNIQGGANTWLRKQGHGEKIPKNTGTFGGGVGGAATPPRGPEPYTNTSGMIPQHITSGGRQGQGLGW